MAGRWGAAGRGRGLWALLLLLLAVGSGAAAPSDFGKVMSIQPWLKMSRPCTDRHLLTPHPLRRCRQLVALVMCGRSLELSQVDLALAVRWLRESVDTLRRSPARERGPSRSTARGNGVYKSLLVRRARLLSSGSGTVICPTHQIKKLRRYFKKKDRQARGKKWNVVGDGDGDGVLSPGSHGRAAVRRRRDIRSREAAAGSAEVDMSLPDTSVQEREAEQGVSSDPVAGLHGGTTTQVGTMGPGPQVFGSDSPRAPVRRSEGGEGARKGDTTERGSLVSHDPELTGPHVSPHNHTAAPVTAHPPDPTPPSANGQGQGGGMGGGGVGIQGAGGGVVLGQGPGQGVGEGEGGNVTARTSPGVGEESRVATGGEGALRGGEEQLNTTVTARAPGSELCVCGGAGAGAGGAVHGVGGAVPGAGGVVGGRQASSVPRARSEEAAWAAAALTVVLALLTVAVLYTRLYRRFIRSRSLYWTPTHCSTESVADIIKRRIVRFGKRKKRPPVRKTFSAPYNALPSEISD